MSVFTFNGQSCAEYGLTVEEFPNFLSARKETEKFQIPGKSGDFLYQSGRYENVNQEYSVYLTPPTGKSWSQAAKDIANWLGNVDGYAVLSDDYDPDSFRLAIFDGPLDMTSWMQRKARATISFDCQPQRYLVSGNTPIPITPGQAITNPGMPCHPLLSFTFQNVNDTVDTIIRMNGNTWLHFNFSSVNSMVTFTIDTYSGEISASVGGIGYFSAVVQDFDSLVFPPGEIVLTATGNIIPSISVTPRWWTL